MKLYVGTTNNRWFRFLAARNPDEVNFWRPRSQMVFKGLHKSIVRTQGELMKWEVIRSMKQRFILLLVFLSSLASTYGEPGAPKEGARPDFGELANNKEKETRNLVARVTRCTLAFKSLSFRTPDEAAEFTRTYDLIEFKILAPADYAGRKWHVFLSRDDPDSRQPPFKERERVELAISTFEISKAALLDLMRSEDVDDGMYVDRSFVIRKTKK